MAAQSTYLVLLKKCFKYSLVLLCTLKLFELTAQGGFRAKFHTKDGLQHTSTEIFETTRGNYLSFGFTVDTLKGKYQQAITVSKLNSNGVVLFTKKIKYSNGDYYINLYDFESFRSQCLKDNNIYFACSAPENNKSIGVLIKFNFNGDTIWQKFYRDNSDDFIPQKVISTIDGGFLVSGIFQDWTNHTWPLLVLKTDSNGNELWRRKISKSDPNWHNGKSMVQDSLSKKIFIAGYQSVGTSSTNFIEKSSITVLDSIGNFIANHYYTGSTFTDLIQTKDGMLVAAGNAYVVDGHTNYFQPFVMKINPNNLGSYMWYYYGNFGALRESRLNAIAEMPNGDILAVGSIDTSWHYNFLARFDRLNAATGALKWQRLYKYSTNDTLTNFQLPMSLNLTSDGGWVVPFHLANQNTNNPLFYVKYDSLGCDSSELYCKTDVSIEEESNSILAIKIYPNPFNNQLTIHSNQQFLKSIRIFDISGKYVYSSVIENQQHSHTVDVGFLAAGLYIANIETDKGRQFLKVIKE